MDDDAIETELRRAEDFCDGLAGHTLDVLTLASPTPEDAPFLGRNISKLSPIVSNLIESFVVKRLADDLDPGSGFDWIRQDPGWPDAGLLFRGTLVGGFEVKAWYVLATEITARYYAAQSAIEGLRARVVLVPWIMDHVVFGQPRILGALTVDAMDLAKVRDAYFHRPPRRIVVEPPVDDNRAANLRQSNVNALQLQRVDADQLERAQLFTSKFNAPPVPHHPETRELNEFLRTNFPYTEDDNFGKVGRTFHKAVKAFESEILALKHRNSTVDAWRTTIRDLGSENEIIRLAAEATVEALYVPDDTEIGD